MKENPVIAQIEKAELLKLWNMVYNISLTMLLTPGDAEDATQEIFLKIQEKLIGFRGDSQLSTWVYRLARNHLLNICAKQQREKLSFEIFEKDVTNFIPYKNEYSLNSRDEKKVISDIKVGCTIAMLQCLDSENRFILIIGTIFNMSGREASRICNISEESYRQRLSRARRKIAHFMNRNCGTVNPVAQCHCRKRVRIAVERGRVDLNNSINREELPTIGDCVSEMNEIDEVAEIYRDNPFIEKDGLLLSQLKQKYRILNDVVLLQ